MDTKTAIHGGRKKGENSDKDVTFFSANINSLAYWPKYNNKAERLKQVFNEYRVNSSGLQEVCVNQEKLPASKLWQTS